MWLLIDDKRNRDDSAIARNWRVAQELLELACWEGMYLDYILDDDNPSTPTGLDILMWAEDNDLAPAKVVIVSTYDDGVDLLTHVLEEFGYVLHDTTWIHPKKVKAFLATQKIPSTRVNAGGDATDDVPVAVGGDSPSRAWTSQEVCQQLVDTTQDIALRWAGHTDHTIQARCEGVAFSLLALLDGVNAAFPGFTLIPRPHPTDRADCVDHGQNYYVAEPINEHDVQLHDLFSHHGTKVPHDPV